MVEELTLKWGTIKGWDVESDKCLALLQKWESLGATMGAMSQRDTPEQKEIICELIDAIDGKIYNDWDGRYMSKDEAKDYVRNYGR